MRALRTIALLALAIGCKGADGVAGPQGPQGIQGPIGPIGPRGSTFFTAFLGQATSASIDLVIPNTITAGTLPIFTCYLSDNSTGPWLVVPFTFLPGAPFCGAIVRPTGTVIALRQWIVGDWYYVAAAWP